jgi:hypothetical protein
MMSEGIGSAEPRPPAKLRIASEFLNTFKQDVLAVSRAIGKETDED